MKYVRDIAKHCTAEGRFMEWTGLSGFPVVNRYQKPDVKPLYFGKHEFEIAIGYIERLSDDQPKDFGFKKTKILGASAPNYIHSRDAAHLVAVVNDSVESGIIDVATVHDSFSCHACEVEEFGRIIRDQLALMYLGEHPLKLLRDANVSDNEFPQPPPQGDFDPLEVQDADYPWM